MKIYDTKSVKEEHRIVENNGNAQFSECEHCGIKCSEKLDWLGIKYYHRYGKILCDRCIDKSVDDSYWDDKDAIKDGLGAFPRPAPEIIEKNLEEQRKYSKRFKMGR